MRTNERCSTAGFRDELWNVYKEARRGKRGLFPIIISRRSPVFIALVAVYLLVAPPQVGATAIANTTLVFQFLTIMPVAGNFSLDGPWVLATVGRASNSQGEAESFSSSSLSPGGQFETVAVGSIDLGQGPVVADTHALAIARRDPPDLDVEFAAGTAVNVPGCHSASAVSTSRAVLLNNFSLTGGGPDVAVNFETSFMESLDVMTDHCGILAFSEVRFDLTVDGDPVFGYSDFLSIGPGKSQSVSFTKNLSTTLTLASDVSPSHQLRLEAYSVSVGEVPEPPAGLLLITGLAALAAARSVVRIEGKGP